MRVLHVTESDAEGGAARAAFRIHQAMASVQRSTGIESYMLVRRRLEDDPRVFGFREPSAPKKRVDRFVLRMAHRERKRLQTENTILHSNARLRTGALRQVYEFAPDAVILHWLGNKVLSIEQVGALSHSGIPVYWVLHDTWAFCGAEHYPNGLHDRRFVDGYRANNRPPWEGGWDVNRTTWERKRRNWTSPMHIIAPSSWMAEMAASSALFRDWPISVVPNPLDIDWWGALTPERAREQLGIARNRRVVLFGAVGGEADSRKGADLLRAAMNSLGASLSTSERLNLEVLTFGGPEGVDSHANLRYRSLGRLDNAQLRLAYTAADAMVVPSRIDNLPQTAVEAIACGTPVAAFRVGGLPDIVEDFKTGRLVEPYSTEELGRAIRWLIQDEGRRAMMSAAARESAEKWRSRVAGEAYSALLGGAK